MWRTPCYKLTILITKLTILINKLTIFFKKPYYFTDDLTILHFNAHLLIVTILEKFTYYFRSLYSSDTRGYWLVYSFCDYTRTRDAKTTIFVGPARPVVPFPGPARPVMQFLILGPLKPAKIY